MKQPTISRIILSLMSLCFFCNVLFAQNMVKVTGTVTDKQNSPMIGASVFEKGTRNGAITDIDGKYSISVPEGAVIVFSSIGFTSQERQAVAVSLTSCSRRTRNFSTRWSLSVMACRRKVL